MDAVSRGADWAWLPHANRSFAKNRRVLRNLAGAAYVNNRRSLDHFKVVAIG